jgi:hypothetical protein
VTDNAGAIAGVAAKNFHHLNVSSPAAITNSTGGNLTVEGNMGVTGQFTQAAALTTTFSTDNNNVTTHSLSGGGGLTFGNLTIDPSNSLDDGTQNFNVVGANLSVSGTLTGANTIGMTGAAAQMIAGKPARSSSTTSRSTTRMA